VSIECVTTRSPAYRGTCIHIGEHEYETEAWVKNEDFRLCLKGDSFNCNRVPDWSWKVESMHALYRTRLGIWKWQGDFGWRNIECKWSLNDERVVLTMHATAAGRKVRMRLRQKTRTA